MFCQGGCSVMAVPWQYRGSTKGTVFQYCGTAMVLPRPFFAAIRQALGNP